VSDPIIPFEALEGVMKKAFLEQAIAPGLFWDALLKANLYVPLAADREMKDPDDIPMLLGVDPDGKHVVWLFTSPGVMLEYTEQQLPYKAFLSTFILSTFRETDRDVVLIGPEGLTLKLHPELVDSLSEGRVPEVTEEQIRHVPKDQPVLVGAPSEESVELESRFIELFESLPDVLEASFVTVAEEGGDPRLLLGLRLTDTSRAHLKVIAQQVAKAAEGILDKGQSMDITLIDGSLKGAFEKWGKFFYKK
jgi:hypothetical protein